MQFTFMYSILTAITYCYFNVEESTGNSFLNTLLNAIAMTRFSLSCHSLVLMMFQISQTDYDR